jgi:CRP/FNR family transcriptional regulator, anaerobic regulatory protein
LTDQSRPNDSLQHVQKRSVACENCPLRRLPAFRSFTQEELAFVSRFKMGEISLEAGKTLLHEGEKSPYVFTLLEGWMYRHKSLPDGRRQILNYSLPGDFMGLQSAVFDEMQHTVDAMTDAKLCVFPRDKLWNLYSSQPGLGFDLTWLVSREEKMLDDHLLSIGRRSALERMAYLVLLLYRRAQDVGLVNGHGMDVPFSQQHVADTLGLSIVHTNKTLRKLYNLGVISWKQRKLTVLKQHELEKIARFEDGPKQQRPFI